MIVVDASVILAWLLDENAPEAPASIFDTLADEIVAVPCHWPLEIGNALRSQLKTGRLTAQDFLKVMDDLDMLHVRVDPPLHPDEIGPLVKFSVDHSLTAYDAAYVQLALRQHATLVTLDKNMRNAAQALNIPVLPA